MKATRLAAIGITIVLLTGGAVPAQVQQDKPAGAEQEPQNKTDNSANAPLFVQVVPAEKTAEEADAERNEREAQNESDRKLVDLTGELAEYTLWLAVATIVLCVATVGLGILAWYQTRQTKRIFESENRPWIPASVEVTGPLHFDGIGAIINIRFVLRNMGKSPAMNVLVPRPLIAPLGFDFPEPAGEVATIANHAFDEANGDGVPVFPNNPIPVDFRLLLTIDQLDRVIEWNNPAGQLPANEFFAVIYGVIRYQSVLGTKHRTGFVIKVGRGDPANTAVIRSINPSGGDIPVHLVRLTQSPSSNIPVD